MSYDPNVPKAPPPSGDDGNRALYFVGGLVVLAAVFVFIFTNNDGGTGTQDTAAPAATEPATPPPAPAPAPAPEGNTGGTTTNQ